MTARVNARLADIERRAIAADPSTQHDQPGLRRADILRRENLADGNKRTLQLGFRRLGTDPHQRLPIRDQSEIELRFGIYSHVSRSTCRR